MRINKPKHANGVSTFVKFVGAKVVCLAARISMIGKRVDKRCVLLESFQGLRIDCSPYSVFRYLTQEHPGEFEYVWAVSNPEAYPDIAGTPDTRLCKYRSWEHRKLSLTAGYLIANTERPNDLPSRAGQVQIQTWHGGGCYKTVGGGTGNASLIAKFLSVRKMRRFNYFISSCEYFTTLEIKGQFDYRGHIVPCGLPRNDALVNSEITRSLADKVRNDLGIDEGELLVLYAPTYRDDDSCLLLPSDAMKLRPALSRRFGKTVRFGYRGHYYDTASNESSFDIDLCDYPHSQELLAAVDVLISDYSSIIWDYSLTGKPCFLYVPDLAEYRKSRGLIVDIADWGFPYADSIAGLCSLVELFDEDDYVAGIDQHHRMLGSYECGKATEAVASLVLSS